LKIEIPNYKINVIHSKKSDTALLIPVINENKNLFTQLNRLASITTNCDVIICDGDSTDGSNDLITLNNLGVSALLIKKDEGKLSTQLIMGLSWAINQGYKYFITIDGNNKDSVENIPDFIVKLKEGFDFVQGSRFIKGGQAINTPLIRLLAAKFIHVPIISISAGYRFTDTTNGFRGFSLRYLTHPEVQPFRRIFKTYELLAYLSVRASQLGLKVTEIPVIRTYPKKGKIPTKISPIKGSLSLIKILILNLFRNYHPNEK
jgi:dolichol-phosphate mannosyltransferase